jgi:hypothetical protein
MPVKRHRGSCGKRLFYKGRLGENDLASTESLLLACNTLALTRVEMNPDAVKKKPLFDLAFKSAVNARGTGST